MDCSMQSKRVWKMSEVKGYFVTGIGTDVGKSIAAAVLVEKLGADYWKPVQAGDLVNTDSMKVERLVTNPRSKFHPERWVLEHAMSPHAAAELQGVHIDLADFQLPQTSNTLVVEGAGGLMVPLNNNGDLLIDLIAQLGLPAIVVARNYLGSINHSILTIEALKQRKIAIAGVLFNGEPVPATENAILAATGVRDLGRIPELTEVSTEQIQVAGSAVEL